MEITNPTAARIQQFLAPVEKAANNVNQAMYQGMNPGMTADAYQANSLPVTVQKVPLQQFFDDTMRPPHPLNYKIANRLAMVGITDSQKFLKAADTPFKRTMMSYLAGGLFLGKQEREYVKYQLGAWAGQADLMRTGTDLPTARLMQVSGAGDIPTLARYGNGIDKGALYAAMAANAIQYGYHMPPMGAVSAAVEKARTLPPQIRWN